MLTHIVRHPYLPNGTNLKLGILEGGRRPTSATGAMTSKVKGQGHVISLNRLGQMLLEAGGGIQCRPNPAATLTVNWCYWCC